MTELAGLGALFVRLGGGYFLIQGLLQLVWSVVWLFSENPYRSVSSFGETLSGASIYFLLALGHIYFSRRLGLLLARSLD